MNKKIFDFSKFKILDFDMNILKELYILIQNMYDLSFLWLVLIILQRLKHWLSRGV